MSFSIKFGPSFVVVFPLNVVLVVNFSHIYLLLQTLNHFATKLENTYNTIMLILNIVISACEIILITCDLNYVACQLCCMLTLICRMLPYSTSLRKQWFLRGENIYS